MELEKKIDEAAKLILSSKYVICLTGAGVSVESGIPPFRGPEGLWTKYGEPPMDGYQRFLENPKVHWEDQLNPNRRKIMGTSILEAEPNPGHLALAEMERMGVLKVLITQNIDNLHIVAGSRKVLEIHGNIHKVRCIECGSKFPRDGFDLSRLPPLCPNCGGVVKGDAVMFGEPVPKDVLSSCLNEAKLCDCILVAGTSATVHPAASIPLMVKRRGYPIIEINPVPSNLTEICDISICAPSGEALPLLVEALKEGMKD